VCKNSAHDATLKIGVILSPLNDTLIQTSWISFNLLNGSKILFPQQNLFAITGMSHEGNCRCNMSLLYIPKCVLAFIAWNILLEFYVSLFEATHQTSLDPQQLKVICQCPNHFPFYLWMRVALHKYWSSVGAMSFHPSIHPSIARRSLQFYIKFRFRNN